MAAASCRPQLLSATISASVSHLHRLHAAMMARQTAWPHHREEC